MKIKNLATATLALSMSTSSFAAFELMTNGGFEDDLNGWGVFADATSSATASTTGGNPDGFGLADGTSGWGAGFVQTIVSNDGEAPLATADYGYAGGDTMNFTYDMKVFSGSSVGETGIKFESYAATGGALKVEQYDIDGSADWTNYSQSYVLDPTAVGFKVVLVATNTAGQVGFDNLMIDNLNASAVPVPAAAWLFGSALAGLVAVRRNK